MPMQRIQNRREAFARTASPQMLKFLETYPPKVFKRAGAGRSFTAFSGRRPSLRMHMKTNSMYMMIIG